jgi:siroheme synthase
LRIVTGHDMVGFAEQDWRGLARAGEVAAIYMGKKSARFIQGRLMMHGAAGDTPVTLVENVSRADQRVLATTLSALPDTVALCDGPAIILYGLAPRAAALAITQLHEATA